MFELNDLDIVVEDNLDFSNWRHDLRQGIEFRLKDGNRILIRSMILNDIPDIVDIEKMAFEDPWTEEAFIYDLFYPYKNLVVSGVISQKIVTYLLSIFVADELHLHNIAVHPDFQRKGIGDLMIWYMLNVALQEGSRTCYLEVRVSNKRAISLYKKFGFEIMGRRYNYYQNNNEDAFLMSKKDFPNLEN